MFIKILGKSFDCFFSRYFLRFVATVVQTLSITNPEWVLVRGRMVPNQRQSRIQSSYAFWYFTIEYWQEVCHSLFIVKKYQACVLRLEPRWFLGKWPLTKKPEASECEFEPTRENAPFSGMFTPCKSYLTSKEKKQIPPMRIGSQKE